MLLLQPIHRVKRLFSSVFVRLLLVCLAAWLLITVAVSALFISSRVVNGGPYTSLIGHYLEYLAGDIAGQPERAARLARRLGIGISYQSSKSSWSRGMPLPDHLHFFKSPEDERLSFAFRHHTKCIRFIHPTGVYIFTIPDLTPHSWFRANIHLMALGIIALVFAGAYFLIRRILAPLSSLHEATKSVGRGNLSHEVQVTGKSELAELAESFNGMTRQLQEMMRSKEQLLRDVSHELRSPLTRIKVLLELFEQNEKVEQIRDDIRELEDLITSILETARHFHHLGMSTMEDVDLRALVSEVVSRHGEKDTQVLIDLPEYPVMTKIDRRLFTRVVENLLVNALVHGKPALGPVRIQFDQDGRHVEIHVIDSGPGIQHEDLPHVMEPFYQSDRSRSQNKGFGLGLGLCKTIVEAHGGEFILTSQPGIETKASIRLPAGGLSRLR